LGRIRPLYIATTCLVIGGIGIIGNLVTVVVVATNSKLRKPYFITISTLAVSDLLAIGFRIIGMFLEFELLVYAECLKPPHYIFISSYVTVENNSILQIVLIAVVKFLLLVCPIKSRVHLRNYHIVFSFFVLLLVSACMAFIAFYFIMEKVKANEDITPVLTGNVMITTIPSVLAIIILHIIKIIKLRNSPALQNDLHKMNKVVSVILAIYLLHNVQKSLIVLNIETNFVQNIIRISAFIHHASNPLIYAAFSLWSRRSESG
jgi:hypothetical protein